MLIVDLLRYPGAIQRTLAVDAILSVMKVLVYEDDLLWSSRIRNSLKGLGHEAVIRTTPNEDAAGTSVAIVNLGSPKLSQKSLVPALRAQGVYVIGHAGHKETHLAELGREAGCDRIATNREMATKLESLLPT